VFILEISASRKYYINNESDEGKQVDWNKTSMPTNYKIVSSVENVSTKAVDEAFSFIKKNPSKWNSEKWSKMLTYYSEHGV
jgi:hypothetical protein